MRFSRSLALLAFAAAMTSAATAVELPPVSAGHVRLGRESSFTVARPPADSFSFFEPLGEKRWADDWQPVFATAADARLAVGTVFTVERPAAHGGERVSSLWTITRYEPPHAIEYFNVLLGIRATRIAVRCEPAAPGQTRVTVRYTYTGLSAAGDAAIGAISETAFSQMIAEWSRAIARYLERGTPASP